ncbi:hypothetical protein MMPV_004938 [Pyropia vietnamensis]
MAIFHLLLVSALAVVIAATVADAKVCYFKDPCSRVRLLSGRPGSFVVDACGKELVFSPTCLARRISSCKIKDPCAKKAARPKKKQVGQRAKGGAKKGKPAVHIPMTFRGSVVKDGCGKPYRVSKLCKLIKISAACYRACHVKSSRLILKPGRPFTCASRCK